MTTKDILAQAQFLALREQITPGHPAYEQDFRQLLLDTIAHVHEGSQATIQRLLAVDEENRATIQTLQNLNDDLRHALNQSTAHITRQNTWIEHLAAALDALKRRGDGEAPHVL